MLERSMLTPLRNLAAHLTLIREDKVHLGEAISLRGSPEIQSLTNDFNSLNAKLSDLYNTLENMAFTDQLTELPNRSRLQEVLQFYASQNQKYGTPFALFMMDLDRFKSVNDTLGHHAGDALLQQVSERLAHVLRKTDVFTRLDETDVPAGQVDVIARLGGDEFAALLPSVSNDTDATIVAHKIIKEMQEPFIVEGCSFSIGVSIGIVLSPMHGHDGDTLMRRADIAMYQAKNSQSGFALYDPETDHHSINLLTLDGELKKALEEDGLHMAYQPKIDLTTNKVVGVEALLRWQHPERGFIPPDQFIPMAEQTGLINDITRWVLNKTLQQKKDWEELGIPLYMAINLSAKSLLDYQLSTDIAQALLKTGVNPATYYLELTETAVMSDPTRALSVLNELDSMGIRLSIDDFGTGYSSLSYLKKLPVDEIKIDRSFVMDMEDDANDAIIVRSTIDLAHNMGLSVIAEGVETENILNNLRDLGCDQAQGYFMAKPMKNEELIDWLKNSPWGYGDKLEVSA
jgi:predicted signal transduction protein with EAL and GGDEF domain